MKQSDLQQQLNEIKWLESEKQLRDLGGEMNFCKFCNHKQGVVCDVEEYERTSKCLCAKAYKNMKKVHPQMTAKFDL